MYRSWIAPAEPSVQGPCALLKFGRWIRRRLPVHTIPGMDVSGAASTFRLRWGERFPLLVLDEVHHLADTAAGDVRGWHDALRIAPSPHRLALTATYPDNHDSELRRLVGAVVYRRTIGEMTDHELASFALERRYVPLTSAEAERYAR